MRQIRMAKDFNKQFSSSPLSKPQSDQSSNLFGGCDRKPGPYLTVDAVPWPRSIPDNSRKVDWNYSGYGIVRTETQYGMGGQNGPNHAGGERFRLDAWIREVNTA